MSSEALAVAHRAQDWITWYNYNKPTAGSGLEQRVAFLEKANFGALEIMARLVELAVLQHETNASPLYLPTGVVLHDD